MNEQENNFKLSQREVFDICMELFFENGISKVVDDSNFNYNSLRYDLIKTGLEPYTELLIEYQKKWFATEVDPNLFVEKDIMYNSGINIKIELIELLILLKKNINSIYGVDIIAVGVNESKAKINNLEITKLFYESVLKLFRNKNLHLTPMTYSEAELNIYKSNYDLWRFDVEEQFKADYVKIFGEEEWYKHMVDMFAYSHEVEREINISYLENLLSEFNGDKRKINSGRKRKNDNIGLLALNLSYLIRFYRFINQTECNKIFDYKITNADCRIIFDYLNFYNLIPEKSANEPDFSKHISIVQLIRQYKKDLSNRKVIPTNISTESTIDNLRLKHLGIE